MSTTPSNMLRQVLPENSGLSSTSQVVYEPIPGPNLSGKQIDSKDLLGMLRTASPVAKTLTPVQAVVIRGLASKCGSTERRIIIIVKWVQFPTDRCN